MKKQQKGRKLSRKKEQRDALLESLVREFFLKEKIKTTEAKAKELVPFAEKEITRAKIGNLQSQRLLNRKFSPELVKKIITEIAPRYKDRKGGYARIIKLGPRKSDGARIAIVELIK